MICILAFTSAGFAKPVEINWDRKAEVETKLIAEINADNGKLRNLLEEFFATPTAQLDIGAAKKTYLKSIMTDAGEMTWDNIEPYLKGLRDFGVRDVSFETKQIVIRYVPSEVGEKDKDKDKHYDLEAEIVTEIQFGQAPKDPPGIGGMKHRRNCTWY